MSSSAKGLNGEMDSDDEGGEVRFSDRQRGNKRRRKGTAADVTITSRRHFDSKGKDWVLKKKELRRKRGYGDVPNDSKYTGRKRKTYF